MPLRRFGQAAEWLRAHVSHEGDECLIWPRWRGGNGYGFVVASVVGKSGGVKAGQQSMVASRAMCILAHGDPPTPKHLAAHSCGNGHLGCVHPGHLRWATQSENMADRMVQGVLALSEDAVPNVAQVKAIRTLAKILSIGEIAVAFRCSPRSIEQVLLGSTSETDESLTQQFGNIDAVAS